MNLRPRLFLEAWNQPVGLLPGRHPPLITARSWQAPVCPTRVLGAPPTGLNTASNCRMVYPSPSPLTSTIHRWCRNVDLLAISYAFRPRLRSRLTLSGLTWPRKPWAYGEPVSHRLYRYSCQHNHFQKLQPSFRSTFSAAGTLPYHHGKTMIRSFGDVLEPR